MGVLALRLLRRGAVQPTLKLITTSIALAAILGCAPDEMDDELAEDESPLFDREHGLIEARTSIAATVPGELYTHEQSAIGVAVPRRGLGVWAEIIRDDGSREDVRVETDSLGDVALISDAEAAVAAAASSAPDACEDRARSFLPFRWDRRFDYEFNAGSIPSSLDAARTETALRAAANNIVRSDNDCGLADLVSATYRYLGRTTRNASVSAGGACGDTDGHNVIAFGDLPAGTLGVTCTWYTLEGVAIESDIKLNKVDHAWTNTLSSSCRDRFLVEAIVTHELGHAFGLGHVSESAHGQLTMSTNAAPCQGSERTLGRGDIIGLRRNY